MIKEERKRQQKKEKFKILIEVILGVAAAACMIGVIAYVVREKKAAKVYEDMQEEIVAYQAEWEETENTEDSFSYPGMPQVNFEALWETNTDVCGWIYIPGTEVNYPVLRNAEATDPYDSYYLQHTVDRQSGLPGAIYIEPCNAGDFSDFNTVFYGHHMKNGSMFASLDSFLEEGFMEENPYVYLVTPEKNMVYQIFAAVQYDDRHIMGSYDFTKPEERQSFLDSLGENGGENDIIQKDIEVTEDDTVITLSTCIKEQDEKRLVVEAVLIDEEEN